MTGDHGEVEEEVVVVEAEAAAAAAISTTAKGDTEVRLFSCKVEFLPPLMGSR